MTTYLCVQCDERFEVPAGDKPRCPKCMRIHGLTELQTSDGGGTPRRLWALSALSLLALAAAAIVWWQRPAADTPAAEEVLAELPAAGQDLSAPLAESEPLRAFAAAHVADGPLPEQIAAAARALREQVQRAGGAWAQPRWEPRAKTSPLLPTPLLSALSRGEAPSALYSLEWSAAVVAVLGAAGQELAVAEIAERAGTPDPSGVLGYFGVARPASEGEPAVVFDLSAQEGRSAEPLAAETGAIVLSSDQVVAIFLGLRALHALPEQPALALTEVDAALKLWPRSPQLRSIRAQVLAATAGVAAAEDAARAAVQLRPDGPRHVQLATFLLAQGALEEAEKQVTQALELDPGLGSAQLLRAGLLISKGETAEAKSVLAPLIEQSPELPGLFLTAAQAEAAAGDLPAAIAQAERALAQHSAAPDARVALAQLRLASGDTEGMRGELQRWLAATPEAQQPQVREHIEALFGADALASGEPPAADDDRAAPDATPSGPLPDFRLSPGKGLLSTPDSPPGQ